MALVLSIDLLMVLALWTAVARNGLEKSLKWFAFCLMLFPVESQIAIPGLFDLTTQRVCILLLAILYSARGKQRTQKPQRAIPLTVYLILLIAWMLLSSATSVVPSVSFKAVLSQVFDFIIPYYIFVRVVSNGSTVDEIMGGFVSAIIICSGFGVFEIYEDWSVMTLFPTVAHRFSNLAGVVADRGLRVQSTFGHPILFGAALCMGIPLALYLISVARSKAMRTWLWLGVLLMFVNIYKTSSRGPWMALAGSLLIVGILARGSLRKYIVVIGILTIAVLVARPGVWTTIADLYGETLDPDTAQGASYEWRYALYHIARQELSASLDRGLWGYGPESFFYLGLTGEFQGTIVRYDSCDSSVVELMMDTGYVGLGIVALLLAKAAWLAFRDFLKLNKSRRMLPLVLFCNIVAFSFLMTNVELFGWGQQSYMLWIIIAVAAVYRSLPEIGETAGAQLGADVRQSWPGGVETVWAQ